MAGSVRGPCLAAPSRFVPGRIWVVSWWGVRPCGCRILLRFPIAEALTRLTGPGLASCRLRIRAVIGSSAEAWRCPRHCGRPRGPPFGTAALERGNPSSNVVLKVRPAVSYSWVGDQDFTHRVRETDGDWPAVSQLASVVVQLGQAEDVPRDLFDGCLTMLNIDPQRDRSLPAVIRSQPRLEPRCVKESRAIVYLQERPPQDGRATDAKESGAVTITAARGLQPSGSSRSGSDRFRSFCGKTSKSV